MNKKFKSVLASCLAVSMLFSACGEVEKKDKKDDKKENSFLSSEYNFNFSGLNDVLGYAENSLSTLSDSIQGDINTSVSTDLSVKFGDMINDEIGYDIGEIAISNNAKVKNNIVANDLSLKYNNKSLASLNCIVDSEGVGYVRIPELSDDYIKADLISLIESEADISIDEMMNSYEIPEELTDALEKFDEEKITELFETYLGIIEKNVPESQKGDDYSGKINDLEYTYETKEYTITGKIAFDCVSEFLDEVKNDKEIAALWNEIVDMQKQEAAESGYYTDEELEEYYPSFETTIAEYIDNFNDGKDDAYSTDDVMIIKVFYDDDRVMGFNAEEDGEEFTVAMIDEKTSFGVGFDCDFDEESVKAGFTVEGEDGKYDGEFAIDFTIGEYDYYTDDYEYNDYNYSLTFDTDVTIVDEKTGAFKGDINIETSIEGEKIGLSISSDSTAKKSDVTYTAKYNGKDVITIGVVNVITDATNITVPKVAYDISNETELEEYSKNCDVDGFMENIKDVIGDDLYEELFGSSYDDDYDYDYDYDYDWDDDYNWYEY